MHIGKKSVGITQAVREEQLGAEKLVHELKEYVTCAENFGTFSKAVFIFELEARNFPSILDLITLNDTAKETSTCFFAGLLNLVRVRRTKLLFWLMD